MADMGHVDADLMRAAGLQPAGDEARRPERLLEPPMGDRPRPRVSRTTAILLAMARMAAERRVDRARRRLRSSPQTSARYSRTSEPVRP